MQTFIIELPDPTAIDGAHGALADLPRWLRARAREIRERWVLSPRAVMVVCTEAAASSLRRPFSVRPYVRTTRWAMLTSLHAGVDGAREPSGEAGAPGRVSRHFTAGQELVILPPVPLPDGRVRVLGVRAGGRDLAVVKMGQEKLHAPRVGKLDHPALLHRLEAEGYWSATEAAHTEATRQAAALRARWHDTRGHHV